LFGDAEPTTKEEEEEKVAYRIITASKFIAYIAQ